MWTLELCAKAAGLNTERDDLCLRYQKTAASDFAAHRADIATGVFTSEQLVSLFPDLEREPFDEQVPKRLLQMAFVSEVLDLHHAQEIAAR